MNRFVIDVLDTQQDIQVTIFIEKTNQASIATFRFEAQVLASACEIFFIAIAGLKNSKLLMPPWHLKGPYLYLGEDLLDLACNCFFGYQRIRVCHFVR